MGCKEQLVTDLMREEKRGVNTVVHIEEKRRAKADRKK